MKKIVLLGALALTTFTAMAIDLQTYRKIDSRGMDGGQVLQIAGNPDSRQRNWDDSCGGIVEKLFYEGTDSALKGKTVVVELCKNKVTRVSTN